MQNKFIIWGPQGPTNPRATFNCRYIAERVARDMAKRYVGQEFFVMKAKSVHKVTIPEPEVEYFGRWRPKQFNYSTPDPSSF